MVLQKTLRLPAVRRGFHLITSYIQDKLSAECERVCNGLLHMLLLHTSASLSLNENSDPSVRDDFETFTNAAVPEHFAGFTHTYEGPDDMPAHIKSSLYGTSLTLPVHNARIVLGTWQGVYLNEHRDRGSSRSVFCTLVG